MACRIEDYALIGDCETAALVGRDGSIDWLCWPRFDSPACFAALLGAPDHGRWRIAPHEGVCRRRRYLPGTLIFETEFETATGTVTVTDFMPPRGEASDLVRIVSGRAGIVTMKSELTVRFDYGSAIPWVRRLDDGLLEAIAGPDRLILRSDVPACGEGPATVSDFEIGEGQSVSFVLCHGPSYRPHPIPRRPDEALAETKRFWRNWAGRCSYAGEWSDAVERSLITLKALTYAPTGGLVAAPTTSLPEWIGGTRNWDYRFCWLRDATLTLLAMMDAGYYEEAAGWREWLLRAVAGDPAQVQIMYGIAGERWLPEREVPWLSGYEGSAPVRIGNGAAGQRQLDVFGEVMDALHQARHGGLCGSAEGWTLQRALIERVEQIWCEPDEGIWETRGGRKHFTHSKVMAWLALDRAIHSAEEFGLDGPVDRWCELRARIRREVCAKGFNPQIGSFVQSYGSDVLDASLLMLPLVGFIPARDPRMAGTVRAIERQLMPNGLVLRYDTEATRDGLPAGEGAFLACSFWLVDNYALQGRGKEARALFERLVGLSNDVGLLAEEYDPLARRQLGNFPQAFSHLALVSSALNLDRKEAGPAGQRFASAASGAESTGEAGD